MMSDDKKKYYLPVLEIVYFNAKSVMWVSEFYDEDEDGDGEWDFDL